MTGLKANLRRRNFLKLGAAGAAAFLAKPAAGLGRKEQTPAPPEKGRKIITRTLGKRGIKLPVVSMGVMNSDNPNLVRAALDRGIVMLDTAHGYQRGNNETMIGGVIKGRPRDSFVIATKVPAPGRDRRTGAVPSDARPEPFIETFNLSLQRLGLDYVDILYQHNVQAREQALNEGVLSALQKIKKDGKARFIGVTTHANEPEVIRAAIESRVHDAVLTSYNIRQDHREEVRKAIAEATQAGIGIVAMKTQAGGYWDNLKLKPINMKAALKWVLNDPNVTTAVPGMTTFDQLEADLSVMTDITLTEQEMKDLRLEAQGAGFYCQHCGQCLPACPAGLPVPDIMRSYMYAYAYRNRTAAQDLLNELALSKSPCQSCAACSVRCAKGYDVAARIKDIVRLKNVPAEFLA